MKRVVVVLILVGLVQWWTRDPTVGATSSDVRYGYVVKYTGDAGHRDNLPMLIALHGDGDNANHFYKTALDELTVPARVVLIKGPTSYGSGRSWPWKPEDLRLYADALAEVAVLLAKEYPTSGKPLLLGFSGGAVMAFYQAARYGDSYSKIIAVSGRLSREQMGDLEILPGASVHAFHGRVDELVPIDSGTQAVQMLRAGGVEVTMTEFDGGHLGMFTTMKSSITQRIVFELEAIRNPPSGELWR